MNLSMPGNSRRFINDSIATRLAIGAATLCLGLVSIGAHAQSDWPKAKPVNIVVGFGPGAFTDTIARVVAQKLGELNASSFIVKEKFAQLGMESARNSSGEFAAFLRDEVNKWQAVVRSTDTKVE